MNAAETNIFVVTKALRFHTIKFGFRCKASTLPSCGFSEENMCVPQIWLRLYYRKVTSGFLLLHLSVSHNLVNPLYKPYNKLNDSLICWKPLVIAFCNNGLAQNNRRHIYVGLRNKHLQEDQTLLWKPPTYRLCLTYISSSVLSFLCLFPSSLGYLHKNTHSCLRSPPIPVAYSSIKSQSSNCNINIICTISNCFLRHKIHNFAKGWQ